MIEPLPWSDESRAALAELQDLMRSALGDSLQQVADAQALKLVGEDENVVRRALDEMQVSVGEQLLASGSSTSHACGMSHAFADLVRTRLMMLAAGGKA